MDEANCVMRPTQGALMEHLRAVVPEQVPLDISGVFSAVHVQVVPCVSHLV